MVDEFIEDTVASVLVADALWTNHWSDYFTLSYSSPTVYGGYYGDENPRCGGIHKDVTGNAYYCEPDHYIAWDWNLFLSQYADDAIGDSFVYFVIAHERGHAIQAQVDRDLVLRDADLQADCLAAAVLIGAARDGTLLWEPGDRGEIFQSPAFVADEFEWGCPADHGSADQRIEAYQLGERGGVDACFE